MLSLVMKKSLRRVQKAVKPKSANERCTGARITGPLVGTCSLPATLGRKSNHITIVKIRRMIRYPTWRSGSMANS